MTDFNCFPQFPMCRILTIIYVRFSNSFLKSIIVCVRFSSFSSPSSESPSVIWIVVILLLFLFPSVEGWYWLISSSALLQSVCSVTSPFWANSWAICKNLVCISSKFWESFNGSCKFSANAEALPKATLRLCLSISVKLKLLLLDTGV